MLTGNKGEWSEIYTLLKILSDRKLYAGDSELNSIKDLIFPIIKILRDDSTGTHEYAYDRDLVVIKGSQEEFRIPFVQFQVQAASLLTSLQQETSATFSLPETEEFISSFNCISLKAKSSVKSDIRVVIHDHRTGTKPELGFSIKSQLGGASTLLNAGRTTNFIYKIKSSVLSSNQIESINLIDGRSKIKDRIENIHQNIGTLEFLRTENSIFGNNLALIDSSLPRILAEILLKFFTSRFYRVTDLLNEIIDSNPLGYDLSTNHPFYSYKIKRFLTDIALGMMPSKVWKGQYDATGGYLIVKNNGEIVCYHIYNRNEFEDYLLKNTKLETASSKRHRFGEIYEENGELFFKLNLQIRFIK